MGLRDQIKSATPPLKEKTVALGEAEGLSEEITVLVTGMMLGQRSRLMQKGFKGGEVLPVEMYPTALRMCVKDPATREPVWTESAEDTEALNQLPGPVADKLIDAVFELTGIGKAPAKNGSGEGENKNT